MGKTIVMKTTIDHLVNTKQLEKIEVLMGEGMKWEKVEMEDNSMYYKLEN